MLADIAYIPLRRAPVACGWHCIQGLLLYVLVEILHFRGIMSYAALLFGRPLPTLLACGRWR